MLKNRHLAILAIISTASTITACSGDVIDGRNSEVSNGLVYRAGDNTPFSGKITNFPESQIKAYPEFTDLIVLMNRSEIKHQNNTLIGRNLMCTIITIDGVINGEISCATPASSSVRYKANYKNGILDGRTEIFDHTGQKLLIEANFKNGVLDGELKRYSLTTGKLVQLLKSSNGLLHGDQKRFDENTGNLIHLENSVNGYVNGVMEKYSANGKLIYRGVYKDNLKDGLHEAFDENTGNRVVSANWSNNKLNGSIKKWDPAGNIIEDAIYRDGMKVSSAEPSTRENKTYNLWCNPRSDFCDYEGKQLERSELPKHIPMAEPGNCPDEACYNEDGNVTGLNPDYFLKK